MCKYSYYNESPTTKKQMIYCKLFENEKKDMEQICLFQKYCRDKDIYLENNQNRCKNFYQ